MPITYGSICSGIDAATTAWHPLGMDAMWYSEIEPFPSAVLNYHYPNTPNLGDMIKLSVEVLRGKIMTPDILVGGTPCQAFSVAGMREGLADPRGRLTIKYVELADAVDYVRVHRGDPASIIVWENVPGVLSDKGNAFGCFLGALAGENCELQPSGKRWEDAGCVYGPKRTIAWRILDAQYFGLAQRRRRVFVVASARNGFDPLEVLFERESLRRDFAPRRGEGSDVAGSAPFGPALQCGCGYIFSEELGPFGCMNCEGEEGPAVSIFAGIPAFGAGHGSGSIERSGTLTHHSGRQDFESETFLVQPEAGTKDQVTGTLQACGKAAGSATQQDAHSGLLVVHGTQDPCVSDTMAFVLGRNDGQENAIFSIPDVAARATALVRRLTPLECERLQGFPDNYTLIPWRGKPAEECPDGPRYRAVGNSMAVTVVRWIGVRIARQLA